MKRFATWMAVAGLLVAFCESSRAQQPARLATVKGDSLPVYARMSTASKVLRALKKGDQVSLDLEVISSGAAWCGVREPVQSSWLGYVLCKDLDRPERPPDPVPGGSPGRFENGSTGRDALLPWLRGSRFLQPKDDDEQRDWNLVRMLVEKEGRNPNELDAEGVPFFAGNQGYLGLHKPGVLKAWIAAGANVNARSHGETALMRAMIHADVGAYLAQILLAAGADVNAHDDYGKTALYLAALWGRTESARVLLAAGANVDARFGSIEIRTPLMTAAEQGHSDTVQVLLAGGANPRARDKHGRTALSLAREKGHATIIQMLEEAAAGGARRAAPAAP